MPTGTSPPAPPVTTPPPSQPAVPPDPTLYGQFLNGYQYRDQLIPQEFWYMTFCFSILLPIMGVASQTSNRILAFVLVLLIGLAGLVALLAYLLDIMANATCKGYLRGTMVEMERHLPHHCYWQVIAARPLLAGAKAT